MLRDESRAICPPRGPSSGLIWAGYGTRQRLPFVAAALVVLSPLQAPVPVAFGWPSAKLAFLVGLIVHEPPVQNESSVHPWPALLPPVQVPMVSKPRMRLLPESQT